MKSKIVGKHFVSSKAQVVDVQLKCCVKRRFSIKSAACASVSLQQRAVAPDCNDWVGGFFCSQHTISFRSQRQRQQTLSRTNKVSSLYCARARYSSHQSYLSGKPKTCTYPKHKRPPVVLLGANAYRQLIKRTLLLATYSLQPTCSSLYFHHLFVYQFHFIYPMWDCGRSWLLMDLSMSERIYK